MKGNFTIVKSEHKKSENKLKNSKSIEFIDIGCGYGNNSFCLKKQFPHFNITLLEISSERINIGIDSFKPDLKEFTFCHSLLDAEFANKNTDRRRCVYVASKL